jgi:hypothetical protein
VGVGSGGGAVFSNGAGFGGATGVSVGADAGGVFADGAAFSGATGAGGVFGKGA